MPKGLKRENVPKEIQQRIADDVGVHISPGNSKLGHVASVSILPVSNCPGMLEECKYCYARAIMKYSTWTEVQWTCNNFYAHNLIGTFEEDICAHVCLSRCKYFRIHVGGDFFNQDYLDMWFRIGRRMKDTVFLAFTKSTMLDYSKKPDNLNIIWSVFPSSDFRALQEGPRAYTEFDTIKRYYPPEEVDRLRQAIRCIGNCESCGMCFHMDSKMDVKFHAYGSLFNFVNRKRGSDGRFLPNLGV